MKALFVNKKGLGEFFIDFKPIDEDWFTWKASITGYMKLIHEKCYFKIAMGINDDLPFLSGDGCTFCGDPAPESVYKFISLANKLKDYKP